VTRKNAAPEVEFAIILSSLAGVVSGPANSRLRERASIINSAGYRVTPAILSPVIRPYFYGRAEHVNTDDVRRARCARTIWFDDARQPLLISAHRRSLSLALLLFPSLFPPRASKDRTLYESPALREAPANISSAGSGPRAFRFFLSEARERVPRANAMPFMRGLLAPAPVLIVKLKMRLPSAPSTRRRWKCEIRVLGAFPLAGSIDAPFSLLQAYPLGECTRDALASVIELALGCGEAERNSQTRLIIERGRSVRSPFQYQFAIV